MLLSEALTKLKNLKSRVTRTEAYIQESAVFYKDETPPHDYEAEMLTRCNLQEEIVALKTKIQVTNSATLVDFNGQKCSLTEVILRNAQLRAELAFLAKQMEHSLSDSSYRFNTRTQDQIPKQFAKGCDKTFFKSEIDRLEKVKEHIEAVMANANASTPLIEG